MRCSKCKIDKLDIFFGSNKYAKNGKQHWCKDCRKEAKDFISLKGVIPKVIDLEGEEWRKISEPGFEKLYAVSNKARIKAIAKVVNHPHSGYMTLHEKIIKTRVLKV